MRLQTDRKRCQILVLLSDTTTTLLRSAARGRLLLRSYLRAASNCCAAVDRGVLFRLWARRTITRWALQRAVDVGVHLPRSVAADETGQEPLNAWLPSNFPAWFIQRQEIRTGAFVCWRRFPR